MLPNQYIWRFVPDTMAGKVAAEYTQPLLFSRFGTTILAYNSELNKSCPVSNFWELTQPEWKGKVFIEDPLNDASTLSKLITYAGHTTPDKGKQEKKLRELIDAGLRDSDEYRAIHARMLKVRAEHTAAGFEAVRKSMLELLAYAGPLGIRLGLENRYHYLEYPSPDELQILLNLAGPGQIGFIYDIGHAQALSRLGFYPKNEWLERFALRIIGTHLHDVINTTDHYAPGLGDTDFDTAAAALPENAFRTCEFQTSNSPEQVKAGLKFLVEHNCIKKF